MSLIKKIDAYEILDSRGNPTIETQITLDNGSIGRACVPSGASTGSYEAIELRDNDQGRYGGKGVLKAINNIHTLIFPIINNQTCLDQRHIDQLMINLDGTANKSKLGANAMLAVSLAVAKARAQHLKQPLYQALTNNTSENYRLPMPMVNVINGGAHADSNVDFQEFMIVPTGAQNFSQALQWVTEIFHSLKALLKSKGLMTAVGDEGGFAPNLQGTQHALDLLVNAIEQAGFKAGSDIQLALDVAANEFFKQGHYHLHGFDRPLTSADMVKFYQQLHADYPIVSIEDGLAEDDFAGWQLLASALPCQLVGDDLFVTNKQRLQQGIDDKLANAILIKLNQIGTLTETLDTMALAKQHNFNCVMSHRSGETEDTTIADLAVATGCGQIKTGSVSRTDRVAKYNQLLRIERQLGDKAVFINPFN